MFYAGGFKGLFEPFLIGIAVLLFGFFVLWHMGAVCWENYRLNNHGIYAYAEVSSIYASKKGQISASILEPYTRFVEITFEAGNGTRMTKPYGIDKDIYPSIKVGDTLRVQYLSQSPAVFDVLEYPHPLRDRIWVHAILAPFLLFFGFFLSADSLTFLRNLFKDDDA